MPTQPIETRFECGCYARVTDGKIKIDHCLVHWAAPSLLSKLRYIVKITDEWDANHLGSVQVQRKRWQRCGEIARNILAEKGL